MPIPYSHRGDVTYVNPQGQRQLLPEEVEREKAKARQNLQREYTYQDEINPANPAQQAASATLPWTHKALITGGQGAIRGLVGTGRVGTGMLHAMGHADADEAERFLNNIDDWVARGGSVGEKGLIQNPTGRAVAQGVGQVAGMAATGPLSYAQASSSAAGHAYQQAKDEGGTALQQAGAGATGAAVGLLDRLILGATNPAGAGLKEGAKRVGMGVLTEGATEGLQSAVQQTVESALGLDRGDYTDIAAQAWEEAKIGGMVGGLVGGAAVSAPNADVALQSTARGAGKVAGATGRVAKAAAGKTVEAVDPLKKAVEKVANVIADEKSSRREFKRIVNEANRHIKMGTERGKHWQLLFDAFGDPNTMKSRAQRRQFVKNLATLDTETQPTGGLQRTKQKGPAFGPSTPFNRAPQLQQELSKFDPSVKVNPLTGQVSNIDALDGYLQEKMGEWAPEPVPKTGTHPFRFQEAKAFNLDKEVKSKKLGESSAWTRASAAVPGLLTSKGISKKAKYLKVGSQQDLATLTKAYAALRQMANLAVDDNGRALGRAYRMSTAYGKGVQVPHVENGQLILKEMDYPVFNEETGNWETGDPESFTEQFKTRIKGERGLKKNPSPVALPRLTEGLKSLANFSEFLMQPHNELLSTDKPLTIQLSAFEDVNQWSKDLEAANKDASPENKLTDSEIRNHYAKVADGFLEQGLITPEVFKQFTGTDVVVQKDGETATAEPTEPTLDFGDVLMHAIKGKLERASAALGTKMGKQIQPAAGDDLKSLVERLGDAGAKVQSSGKGRRLLRVNPQGGFTVGMLAHDALVEIANVQGMPQHVKNLLYRDAARMAQQLGVAPLIEKAPNGDLQYETFDFADLSSHEEFVRSLTEADDFESRRAKLKGEKGQRVERSAEEEASSLEEAELNYETPEGAAYVQDLRNQEQIRREAEMEAVARQRATEQEIEAWEGAMPPHQLDPDYLWTVLDPHGSRTAQIKAEQLAQTPEAMEQQRLDALTAPPVPLGEGMAKGSFPSPAGRQEAVSASRTASPNPTENISLDRYVEMRESGRDIPESGQLFGRDALQQEPNSYVQELMGDLGLSRLQAEEAQHLRGQERANFLADVKAGDVSDRYLLEKLEARQKANFEAQERARREQAELDAKVRKEQAGRLMSAANNLFVGKLQTLGVPKVIADAAPFMEPEDMAGTLLEYAPGIPSEEIADAVDQWRDVRRIAGNEAIAEVNYEPRSFDVTEHRRKLFQRLKNDLDPRQSMGAGQTQTETVKVGPTEVPAGKEGQPRIREQVDWFEDAYNTYGVENPQADLKESMAAMQKVVDEKFVFDGQLDRDEFLPWSKRQQDKVLQTMRKVGYKDTIMEDDLDVQNFLGLAQMARTLMQTHLEHNIEDPGITRLHQEIGATASHIMNMWKTANIPERLARLTDALMIDAATVAAKKKKTSIPDEYKRLNAGFKKRMEKHRDAIIRRTKSGYPGKDPEEFLKRISKMKTAWKMTDKRFREVVAEYPELQEYINTQLQSYILNESLKGRAKKAKRDFISALYSGMLSAPSTHMKNFISNVTRAIQLDIRDFNSMVMDKTLPQGWHGPGTKKFDLKTSRSLQILKTMRGIGNDPNVRRLMASALWDGDSAFDVDKIGVSNKLLNEQSYVGSDPSALPVTLLSLGGRTLKTADVLFKIAAARTYLENDPKLRMYSDLSVESIRALHKMKFDDGTTVWSRVNRFAAESTFEASSYKFDEEGKPVMSGIESATKVTSEFLTKAAKKAGGFGPLIGGARVTHIPFLNIVGNVLSASVDMIPGFRTLNRLPEISKGGKEAWQAELITNIELGILGAGMATVMNELMGFEWPEEDPIENWKRSTLDQFARIPGSMEIDGKDIDISPMFVQLVAPLTVINNVSRSVMEGELGKAAGHAFLDPFQVIGSHSFLDGMRDLMGDRYSKPMDERIAGAVGRLVNPMNWSLVRSIRMNASGEYITSQAPAAPKNPDGTEKSRFQKYVHSLITPGDRMHTWIEPTVESMGQDVNGVMKALPFFGINVKNPRVRAAGLPDWVGAADRIIKEQGGEGVYNWANAYEAKRRYNLDDDQIVIYLQAYKDSISKRVLKAPDTDSSDRQKELFLKRVESARNKATAAAKRAVGIR